MLNLRGAEIAYSAGLILLLSVSVMSLIANSSLIHPASTQQALLPAPQGSSNVFIQAPSSATQNGTDIAVIMLGGILLLAAFMMVWMRDRFVTSLKEMLLILSLTFIASFAYVMVTSFIRLPAIAFDMYVLRYILIAAIALVASLSFMFLKRQRMKISKMPEDFQTEKKEESFSREDVFRLAMSEGDEVRRQIYLCYLRFCSETEKAGVSASESLTAREYNRMVRESLPEVSQEASFLTSSFEEARYSRRIIPRSKVDKVVQALNAMEEKLLTRKGVLING